MPCKKKLYKKYPAVIKLLDYMPFKNKVILDKLYELGIVDPPSGPRPLEVVSRTHYDLILKLGMGEEV